ncbi:MAG: hypothetical protein GTO45_17455 [Candidatus Aminicenantes bacterium]|nr:hypothetical protein [Candidatus Aminicenantes bacterium]NIM78497.1 hypothetical protein [Candidatus Aminicenantes bacterium]NIN19918.1 hypothetical protein [Candidatus Aminicenantes bacterium]NIN41635.1 hypothetical protein [Candidatus Aminicenantes bacterium]NIN86544.1 hypothetical protein [Candidatus Aminicenantes bacterium]
MKLLNRGVNPYVSVQASLLEKNSLHPCIHAIPYCPVNKCGTCSFPFAVALC